MYGLAYSPARAASRLPTLGRATYEEWKALGIEFVRMQWHDLTSTTRFRVFPLESFVELLTSERPGMGMLMAAFGIADGGERSGMVNGLTYTGEYLFTPDLSSMRKCGYAPGHASVMIFAEYKNSRKGLDGKDTFEVDTCPRTVLRRVVGCVRSSHTAPPPG